jgi:hypothetical protein
MRKTGLALLCAMCVLSASLWAQAPAGPPKPAPELKKLQYFAGNWNVAGDSQPGPWGPGGKWTGTDHMAWTLNGFFLQDNSQGDGAMGKVKGVAYFGYDPEKKAYTYNAVDSMGMTTHAEGTVSGSDWTWTNREVHGGKTMDGKYMVHVISPTEYTLKLDMSDDGGKTWKTMMDGKATKAAPAAAASKPAADKK